MCMREKATERAKEMIYSEIYTVLISAPYIKLIIRIQYTALKPGAVQGCSL